MYAMVDMFVLYCSTICGEAFCKTTLCNAESSTLDGAIQMQHLKHNLVP